MTAIHWAILLLAWSLISLAVAWIFGGLVRFRDRWAPLHKMRARRRRR